MRVVLTENAAKMVTPVLFRAITGHAAVTNEWELSSEAPMSHIDLAWSADLFLVAPASAGVIGKLANGIADDLLTTTALALAPATPRAFAPAMNPNMWNNPAVSANVARLSGFGYEMIEPGAGWTACGVPGTGRLAEPSELVAYALGKLKIGRP